ncbi:phosphate-starvation-inducible PsiE family protein [Magnetovibrio sp. PR-2]|uniref:phosphate-starvation-inducible protein PsiE n=1 Tax=Magnetovibrio sp. PR-2 TaxID=3120356 RepID=UPI002FCE0CE1
MLDPVDKAAASAIHIAEKIGLFLIAIATIIAIGQEVEVMISIKTVRLADLLLLFIYLEVLTMVSSYLKSGAMPIRMPLYIAMVALARYIVLDVKGMENWELIAVTSGILIISLAVLVHRFGHVTYPYPGASVKDDEIDVK